MKLEMVSKDEEKSEMSLEGTLKEDESDVCMTDASNGQDLDNASALTSQLNSIESDLPETPPEENLSEVQEIESTLSIEDNRNHRHSEHYPSDKEIESEDDGEFFRKLREGAVAPVAKCQVNVPLKTKGELLIQDLPPVEYLQISVTPIELQKIGTVLHLIIGEDRKEFIVVVESDGKTDALDNESVLFLSSGEPLGKIHDVSGKTTKPNYSIRFNNAEDIINTGVTVGQDVFFVPEKPEFTSYIGIDALKKQKGSDASWKDNNEPPEEEIDYSDDEQERLAKQKRRAKTRGKEREWDDEEAEDVAPKKMERRDASFNQRVMKRASRNMFHSPPSDLSRSSSSSSSPQRIGSAPPSNDFGSSGRQRNSISPQQFWPPSTNSNSFLPRNRLPSVPPVQFEQSSLPSPQPSESLLLSNVPSFPRFGQFPHSLAPAPQPFGESPNSNVSSFQPFSAPNQASYLPAVASQLNPASLMAAPQSNVPLHQQLLLQPQQRTNTVPINPPPNFNPDQNSSNFLRQPLLTHPMFVAPPAARPTMQNPLNQLPVSNQFFPSGTNGAHVGFSGNLNISQSMNNAPPNSNAHQGQSYGMLQPNSVHSSMFPAIQVQQNIMHPPPRLNNPFVPPQSPPIFVNHQGSSVNSNAYPQVFPNQTPPLSNQQNFSNFSNAYPQILANQNRPSTLYYHTSSAPRGPAYGQSRPF